jgi:hypothetical protein
MLGPPGPAEGRPEDKLHVPSIHAFLPALPGGTKDVDPRHKAEDDGFVG